MGAIAEKLRAAAAGIKPPSQPRGRRRIVLTPDKVLAVLAAYKNGMSVDEVSKQEGVSAYLIRGVLISHRVGRPVGRPRGKRGRRSPERNLRYFNICRDYVDGMTLEEVGRRHGISRERVRQILRNSGIPSRSGHSMRFNQAKELKARVAIVVEHARGATPLEISRLITGRSPAGIDSILRDYALNPHGPGQGSHPKSDEARNRRNAQIVEDYTAGLQIDQVAHKCHTTAAVISSVLRKQNVPMRLAGSHTAVCCRRLRCMWRIG